MNRRSLVTLAAKAKAYDCLEVLQPFDTGIRVTDPARLAKFRSIIYELTGE